MRVLVIDDDEAFLGMVRAALEEEGHTVVTAGDGGSGLASARRAPPDAIVLDLRMPGSDGYWFSRAYARGRGRHAPILVISGHPEGARQKVDGAVAYLAKPFELDRLIGELRRVGGMAPTS